MSAPPAADIVAAARRALDGVFDPELDEPITDLGFVRSVEAQGDSLVVHLRLPTSFCSPNFAYIMASDAKDALRPLAHRVVVELDDHHDSERINAGLAADAGYRGTFRHEADTGLDELRATFRRKAHAAAMERVLTELLRSSPSLTEGDVYRVTIDDLREGPLTTALLRRRAALGLDVEGTAPVLVDDDGNRVTAGASAALLRRARAVRISVDGNAHFCRGLLATRYPGVEADQSPRLDGAGCSTAHLPLRPPERVMP
jgi:metal-sulfur cluster biosynthetic enzyme